MLYTLCIILILVASILIILAVLVQNPKSGMAANFGASNQVMGVRQTSDFLEKFTWTMAVVIVVLSLLATLAMDRGLVARSNVELEKDANALMEKMIVEDPAPAVPQAELPAFDQQPAPAVGQEAPTATGPRPLLLPNKRAIHSDIKGCGFFHGLFFAASNGLVGHKVRTSAGPVFRREDKIRIRRAVRTVEFSIRFRFIVWAGRPGQGPVCDLDRWNIR